MANDKDTLLIKRYASRRLYNTETSDYVTLDDIAGFIRDGREVQIIDLKTGDDLTRQFLLQIIAEHESRGESVLPVDVLTDLVRSYTTQAQSVVPQFLAASFEMLRDGQSKMLENLDHLPNPMKNMPGFEAMQAQQRAFLDAMMQGWAQAGAPAAPAAEETPPRENPTASSRRSRSSSPICRPSSRTSERRRGPEPAIAMVETAGRVTLWGIEVFLAIAEERSISAAARRLGARPIPRSASSSAISRPRSAPCSSTARPGRCG